MKSQERTKASAEVFTPRSLICEMLDKLPNEVWFDPNKTWLEPSAGDGNFLVEIKARLGEAGHDEIHILENALFSVELIDDNFWILQHRLGYLIDGAPNPALNIENFTISKIHPQTQDLNQRNPFVTIGLEPDEVLHHRNHVCWTALEYDMTFNGEQPGTKGTERAAPPKLPLLPERDLGEWPDVKDALGFKTPDVGDLTIVERVLGPQPGLQSDPVTPKPKGNKTIIKSKNIPKPSTEPKVKKEPKDPKGGGWQVLAENYGKGLTIRTRSPYDGTFWECDHDALVDRINASLKAKGKTLIGEPGPSQKQYGSSSGLREPQLWKRVNFEGEE